VSRPGHAHTTLAELGDGVYFVHRGRAILDVGEERFELDAGGLCHVEAQTPRWFGNAGDTDLVLLIVGAHEGYVGHDGRMVDPADEERRRRQAEGGPLPALTARPGTPPGRPR
jgi:mannose-6-phosphate isomerase-like protein (cupin superfamily)